MRNIEETVLARIFPAQHHQHHQLTAAARKRISLFRNPAIRVFDDVIPKRIKIRDGVIVVMCPDGDRFIGTLLAIAGLFATKHGWSTRAISWMRRTGILFVWAFLYVYPRIHIITRHAGAHRAVSNSRINKSGRATDRDLLDEIMEAVALKGIYQILLVDHAPCGKLDKHEFGIDEQIDDLMRARDRIVQTFEIFSKQRSAELADQGDLEAANAIRGAELDVICLTHVDHGMARFRRKMRLYHTSERNLMNLKLAQRCPERCPLVAQAIREHTRQAA